MDYDRENHHQVQMKLAQFEEAMAGVPDWTKKASAITGKLKVGVTYRVIAHIELSSNFGRFNRTSVAWPKIRNPQSTGVSAVLPGGTGNLSGLSNQPIWANGQRDTG